MSVSGEQLVSLLQATDPAFDQTGKIDEISDAGGGSDSLPTAGFTVKTLDELGQKVFLNICSSPLVPLPPQWPTSSPTSPFSPSTPLGTLITTYLTAPPHNLLDTASIKTAESALAIPIHLSSPPRSTVDHLGNTCTVLDCVINPIVLEATTHSRPFKMFLVQLCLGEAEIFLNRQLDPRFKLPKMKSKGDLAPLNRVSIVSSSTEKGRGSSSASLEAAGEGEQMLLQSEGGEKKDLGVGKKNKNKVVLIHEEHQGDELLLAKSTTTTKSQDVIKHAVRFEGAPRATAAVVTMQLPSTYPWPATSNKNSLEDTTNVQITSHIDSVDVTVPGCTAAVHVPLPLAVHADKATAILSEEKKTLTLTLPFASFEELIRA